MAERQLRHVGKDCLVAFDGNLYSVPARKVRPRHLVEIRATKSQISLHSTTPATGGESPLAVHARAVGRGVRVVDESHWSGLPEGNNRRTTTEVSFSPPQQNSTAGRDNGPLQSLLNRAVATRIEVGRRPLSVYDELTGSRPFNSRPQSKESS